MPQQSPIQHDSLEASIYAEQVRTAFGGPPTNVPSTVLPNVVVALFMAWIMRDQAPPSVVWGWLGLLLAFQLTVPGGMARRFWRTGDAVATAPRWGRLFALQATANGMIWGAAGMLFFPAESTVHLALLCAVLCGMAAGATPVTAMLLPALNGAVTAMLLPLALRILAAGGQLNLVLAGLLLIYWAFTLITGRSHNRLFRDSFRQRLQNVELIRRLTEQTDLAEAAKDEAERADLAKTRFLAAASHDLRQPLHAATLFGAALLEAREVETMRRLAAQLNASIEAIDRLLGALLDISKLDAGAVAPKLLPLPLAPLFEQLHAEMEPLAREKGLTFRARPTPAVAHTDPVLFEQALRNLLSNAIRYTDRGSIMLAARRRGGAWRVEVRDSGIGIPPGEQDNVFLEFYQTGNPERDRRKGLGLGLAIVDRVARLLGCALDLQSAPGKGSVFALTVAAGVAPGVADAGPAVAAPSDLDGLRVLVIDDEAEVLDAMRAMLAQWRCDVVDADSLDQALARMRQRQWLPEVAISDLRLRGDENGVTVLDRLRGLIRNDLPCAVITGDIGAERLLRVRQSGYPVLHKPLRPARLRALLSQCRAPIAGTGP